MIEFLLGVYTGYFLTFYGLAALFIIACLCEHWEWKGASLFWGIIFIVSACMYFHVPKDLYGWAIGGYVVVGIVWSLFRFKKYVRSYIEKRTRP